MDEVGMVWFVMPNTEPEGTMVTGLNLYNVSFFKTKLDAERYARLIYANRKDVDPYGMVYYRKVYSVTGETP